MAKTEASLDIVQPDDPTKPGTVASDDAGAFWHVYRNEGSTFAQIPTKWRVPASGDERGFFRESARTETSGAWTVHDLDGDGRPDLVHTAATARVWVDGEGPFWKVFSNQGSGFATNYTRWALPDAPPTGFNFVRGAYDEWLLADFDGDGMDDLIDIKESPGGPRRDDQGAYWLVYLAHH